MVTYLLSYIKKGTGLYPEINYPGHKAYNCDWEHCLHLAISEDGINYIPLKNDTGILFAEASFAEDNFVGITKTMADPWLFRMADGSFGLCAIRENRNAVDTEKTGCMMLYKSRDLVHYDGPLFVHLSENVIKHPRCTYENTRGKYYLEWESGEERFSGVTLDFSKVDEICHIVNTRFEIDKCAGDFGIKDCIPGNVINITEHERTVLCNYFGKIKFVGAEPVQKEVCVGEELIDPTSGRVVIDLPKVDCVYTDGSVHKKKVMWNYEQIASVDTGKKGTWNISGRILQKKWKFPYELYFLENEPREFYGMSDPCITEYNGKYYLTSSGNQSIQIRVSDTIEGTFEAIPKVIYRVLLNDKLHFAGTWAAELHVIEGTLYMFTSLCENGEWIHVKSCVLRCTGDPSDPDAWEAPRFCEKSDGSLLTEDGISLDMTYFCDNGENYVMWSNRKILYGKDTFQAGTADIYIAKIDSKEPWKLISDPKCILRPKYGWDRYETEVDEGPYVLRHGDDLFVTISGSSTSMGDLYDVGVLHAKSGRDLLLKENWEWTPYPILTKESVSGEFGPGHNCFIKDPYSGDDLMVYHAIPHDKEGKALNRQPGIRRVHWGSNGLPYLEMTSEEDLPEEGADAIMTIVVR